METLTLAVEKLKNAYESKTSIEKIAKAQANNEKYDEQGLMESINDAKTALTDIKEPLKAITETKKLLEAYVIEATAKLNKKQLTIFEL